MSERRCKDKVILNMWHPLAGLREVPVGKVAETVLLEERIGYAIDDDGNAAAWLARGDLVPGKSVDVRRAGTLPVKVAYGYIWTSLGEPPADLFELPEFAEPDRRTINTASIKVNVSAPRVVENFLDLGHLPHVHNGILGDQLHTEVKDYSVDIVEHNEIVATRCPIYSPQISAAATQGAWIELKYRVVQPYCCMVYKSNPIDESRMDVVSMFLQPIDQEHSCAHQLLIVLDKENTDTAIGRFQRFVFGQDKPILENQTPKRLPLDPRAETPIRADKTSIVYRRWLSQKGVTYGVIPALT